MPSVMTANRLRSGEVVYLAEGERWVERLDGARAAHDPSEKATIEAIAARHVAANEVVGAYLMDVRIEAGVPRPTSMREAIRAARGPTA
jgi:hypothetical protein